MSEFRGPGDWKAQANKVEQPNAAWDMPTAAYTDDDIGDAVRAGAMTVEDAIALYQEGAVAVYPAVDVVEGQETWADVEHMGSGATVLADLRNAGATDEQILEVGSQIERARLEGRTL